MLPLNKHIIQITILDDSRRERCEAQCGVDWSSAEVMASANRQIEERFGDGVKLGYLDLSQLTTDHDHHASGLTRVSGSENLPLPLLIIDGVPRIAGQFDIRLLLEAIDTEVEIKHEQ